MYTSYITLPQNLSASPRYLLRFTSILAVFQGGNNWENVLKPKQPEQRHTPDCVCVWWMFGWNTRMNVDIRYDKTFNVYGLLCFFWYSILFLLACDWFTVWGDWFFWVDDLGYTYLNWHLYIYSTWTGSNTPKRKYDKLTNRTWSENKQTSSFVFGSRNWGKFQVGFGDFFFGFHGCHEKNLCWWDWLVQPI